MFQNKLIRTIYSYICVAIFSRWPIEYRDCWPAPRWGWYCFRI